MKAVLKSGRKAIEHRQAAYEVFRAASLVSPTRLSRRGEYVGTEVAGDSPARFRDSCGGDNWAEPQLAEFA